MLFPLPTPQKQAVDNDVEEEWGRRTAQETNKWKGTQLGGSLKQ